MDPRFDLQPTLEVPGLTLRPLRDDDFDALFTVSSDRQIWAVHPAHDRWQPDVFRRFFADAMASGGALVAIDPASGAIIGHSRYDFGRAGPGEIEIGWTFLARDRWGGETNRRMKRAMLTHAFRFLERVIFVVGENNGRSRRAMEKIGGRLTDRIVETPMAGVNARHVVYAIDRETFVTGPLC
ncbi:N-acetyltransferase [bacterium]|nr:MAG: N-acetyltransferase [bacterium]